MLWRGGGGGVQREKRAISVRDEVGGWDGKQQQIRGVYKKKWGLDGVMGL